jgi:hypothetical protein
MRDSTWGAPTKPPIALSRKRLSGRTPAEALEPWLDE